ncbi:hypothetical protein K4K49_006896 [Colletotrichum sp. SAR 10_70]|uniref:Secreted protein n=2 Tax=Colletotrichum gloeosporioides species complex TaxID=2707338 RepID=A0A7J6IUY1_COLFN|nr:uncharacterized protein CGMCC3_g17835 [Colletotrichum fructicola]KAF4480687.1 hypothetical protein CGGC5_v010552 [Colletotrichum fructicola Nara gc5]KAI8155340.1 hypothetical protein K4K50_006702 [Colletotrichum sp. SAR 10_71]KAI8161882.1 hypothetical protein K4K49_006896 [Colletotrichum sp. SAR 10_70]KAI8202066.1 hypothetical protein K4K52_006704 [Colletotrichum sp. SAR 10_76]KAI8253637.1 hypothetical protein K4K53_010034 [Colletotrichum sp. SAR 10_77]KAI8277765.1 hypothetical protein K4K
MSSSSMSMSFKLLSLLLLVFFQCRSVLASGCTQVHCQVTVCAANADEAYNEASLGLVAIMGPDCASWQPGSPTNAGQGACAAGLSTFTGNFDIWRAWTAHGDDYSATFAQWGNFIGATCTGGKTVKCDPKSGQYPNPTNGRCQTQQCVLDKSC